MRIDSAWAPVRFEQAVPHCVGVSRPATDEPDKTASFEAFQKARVTARDAVSNAALRAPDGYGDRIQTLMTVIQQLGVRIKEVMDLLDSNFGSNVELFGSEIIMRIDGQRQVTSQIRTNIPRYEVQLAAVLDELAELER